MSNNTLVIEIVELLQRFPGEGEYLTLLAITGTMNVIGTVTLRTARSHGGVTTAHGETPVVIGVEFARLFVQEEFRRQRVAERLLAVVEQRARKIRHVASLSCCAHPTNLPAHALYRKLGFNLAFIYSDGDFCFSKPITTVAVVPAINPPIPVSATRSMLSRDIFWSAFIAGKTARWTGYDDDYWWKNVAHTDGFQLLELQGARYRLNPETNEITKEGA